MRILFISSTYHRQFIGYNTNNLNGVSSFANNFCLSYYKNHDITIYGTNDLECYINEINVVRTSNNSRIYEESVLNKKTRTNNHPMINLIKNTDFSKFDLVINNCVFYPVEEAIEKTLELQKTNTKVFSIEHGMPTYYMGVPQRIEHISKYKYIKYLAVSPEALAVWNDLSIKICSKKLFIDYLIPKLTDSFNDILTDTDFSKNINLMLVGRIDPVKRFEDFNLVARNINTVNFKVFCATSVDNPYFNKLRIETLPDNIDYQVNVSVQDKINWIKNNNPITVSTSFSETAGICVFESLMMGLPVVVVDHPKNKAGDILRDTVCSNYKFIKVSPFGILVNPNNIVEGFNEFIDLLFNKVINFDRKVIRNAFLKKYVFNEQDLEKLTLL